MKSVLILVVATIWFFIGFYVSEINAKNKPKLLKFWAGDCETKDVDKKWELTPKILIGDIPHKGKCFDIEPN